MTFILKKKRQKVPVPSNNYEKAFSEEVNAIVPTKTDKLPKNAAEDQHQKSGDATPQRGMCCIALLYPKLCRRAEF